MVDVITLSDVKKDDGHVLLLNSDVPQLSARPRYLWHLNYWDGPLSGICVHEDRKHRFECIAELWLRHGEPDEDGEQDFDSYRVFIVVELTDDDIATADTNHKAFQDHVGLHTDYDQATNKRTPGHGMKPQASIEHYYNVVCKGLKGSDLSDRRVVAWYAVPDTDIATLMSAEKG